MAHRYHFTEAELVAILARQYKRHFAAIAALCDESLDRTGGLLGKVRDAAQQINPPPKKDRSDPEGGIPGRAL